MAYFSHSARTARAQRTVRPLSLFCKGGASDKAGGGTNMGVGGTLFILFILGTPLKSMINSKQNGAQNSGRWDPWQASDKKIRPKKIPGVMVYQQGV